MESYKNYTILVDVKEVIPPLSSGHKYSGQLNRVFDLNTKEDVRIFAHISHAETKHEAVQLVMNEVKKKIDNIN